MDATTGERGNAPPPLLRVLIVEDSPRDAKLVVVALERGGYAVHCAIADTPALFQDCLAQADYDVILADYNLRFWTAIDALEILKQSGKDIPLIVVTGSLGDEAAVECVKQGAADYVLKDRPSRLPVAVHHALEEKRLRLENERAHESASRLATIVESSDDAIIAKNLDGVITSWNAGAQRVFGYSPDEVLGRSVSLLAAPERSQEVPQTLERLRRGERVEHFETVRVRKDGRRIDVSLSLFPLTDARGQVTGVASIARDISERKRAERALRDSEEHFRRLFDNAIVGLYWTTPGGRVLMANRAVCRMLGYASFEELQQRSLEKEGFPPFHPQAEFKRVLEEQDAVIGYEAAWKRADGSAVFVRGSAKAIRDEAGQILYYEGTVEDVTEQKRAEEEKIRLTTAIEQSAEAVVITDIEGAIQYVNPAFSQITGYGREEVLGENPRILKSGQHDAAFYQGLWATILKGETWHGELVNRRKDGSLYTQEMSIAPVRNPRGEITHFIATQEDVTVQKGLEQQLWQARKMEAIGRLAGGVAHDFNNLLTIINGYSQLMIEGLEPDSPFKSLAEEVQKAGERAAGLTRQLLAFSRRQVLAPEILDLNEVLTNIEKMLRRLLGEDVEFRTLWHPALWHVKADRGQIEQVVMNLVVNARDAMAQGGTLTIETANVYLDELYARSHASVTPGHYAVLNVSDTGIGMDPETQKHIFEPFFSTKERGKGTGLGLATVYGIVKQSGGHIWVYSEPGGGTTFKVYLPRAEGEAELQRPTAVRDDIRQGTETILVVEDEPVVRELAARVLQSNGYKVLVASEPEEAVGLSNEYKEIIHLLLTDVVMPKFNGRRLADHLAFSRPGMKVLYMSGYTNGTVVHRGVVLEGAAFLEKPFTPERLLRRVQGLLAR